MYLKYCVSLKKVTLFLVHLTLSSSIGERSLLAVWSCEGPRSSVKQEILFYRAKKKKSHKISKIRVLCVYYIFFSFLFLLHKKNSL